MPLTLPPRLSEIAIPFTTATWPHDALLRFDHAFHDSFPGESVELPVEVEGDGE